MIDPRPNKKVLKMHRFGYHPDNRPEESVNDDRGSKLRSQEKPLGRMRQEKR
jgi:hypothetical protein